MQPQRPPRRALGMLKDLLRCSELKAINLGITSFSCIYHSTSVRFNRINAYSGELRYRTVKNGLMSGHRVSLARTGGLGTRNSLSTDELEKTSSSAGQRAELRCNKR